MPISYAWCVYFPINIIVDLIREVFFLTLCSGFLFTENRLETGSQQEFFKGGRWGGGHNVSHPHETHGQL